MKKIKNKKDFFTGIIAIAISAICFSSMIFSGLHMRLLIAGMIAFVWSIYSFISAVSYKGILEELETAADERDKYLVIKSSHKTLRIMNGVLSGCCFISLALLGVLQLPIFLSIGATLCGVLALLFIVMLCTNAYYEKHN